MLRITNSRTSVRYLLNDKPLYPLNLMKLNARTCQGNPTTRKRQTYKQTTKGLTSIRMLVSLTRLFQPLVEDGNDKVTKRDNTTLTQTVYKDSIPPVFGTRNTIFLAIQWPSNKRERSKAIS